MVTDRHISYDSQTTDDRPTERKPRSGVTSGKLIITFHIQLQHI